MPALLELAVNCENYRALPYSGGVMEQPAGLLGWRHFRSAGFERVQLGIERQC